ncbi:alpha/beta hydrolase [Actinoplanes sp. NPDC051411]|jgi:pimeloyl-ACP methyl ester carboxylesterase|uniref:alpha/beta hydrolase n=1 Tax=Actinoplanes sp. NPDC051411 TaxID=3155522 RepID=UPI0034210A59
MTTFVLVPGAWHLPSTFDLLRGELDRLGYPSIAVKLVTSGPEALGGLAEDAAAVRAAIEAVDGPAVVLAHSYGGIPVTEGAAGRPNVQHLVYLAAYLPDVNESMFTLHGMPDPDDTEGYFPIGDDPRAQLYADVPDDVAESAVNRLVRQRIQPWADRVTEAAWHTVPSTYIVTENDGSLPVALQESMSGHAKGVRRIATSHSPFLSRPAELARLLDEIARS